MCKLVKITYLGKIEVPHLLLEENLGSFSSDEFERMFPLILRRPKTSRKV